MKTKVIRSGEKGFEQAKAKMFEPKVLTKKEQIEQVFKIILKNYTALDDDEVGMLVDLLMREVTIRAKLQEAK